MNPTPHVPKPTKVSGDSGTITPSKDGWAGSKKDSESAQGKKGTR